MKKKKNAIAASSFCFQSLFSAPCRPLFSAPSTSRTKSTPCSFRSRRQKKNTKKENVFLLTVPRTERQGPSDTAPSRAPQPRPGRTSRARASRAAWHGPAGRPRGRRCPWSPWPRRRRSAKKKKRRKRTSMRRRQRQRSSSSSSELLLCSSRRLRRRRRGRRGWRACAACSRGPVTGKREKKKKDAALALSEEKGEEKSTESD